MIYLYMLIGTVIGAAALAAYGFYEGYEICKNKYAVAELQAENQKLRNEQADLKASLDVTQQAVDEANKTDAVNQEIINALRKGIKDQSISSACMLDDKWLRDVDKLQ